MTSVKKTFDDEAPLRVNTELVASPARIVREIKRRGWASSVREAIVLGLKLVEKEMIEDDLKRAQVRGAEE